MANNRSLVIRHLTEAGDGTGLFEFADDFSSGGNGTAIPFAGPPKAEDWEITEFRLYMVDTGNFDAEEFGGQPALVQGIEIEIGAPGQPQASLTTVLGQPLRTNGGIIHLANTYGVVEAKGNGASALVATWDFTKYFSTPVHLCGIHTEAIRVTLNDDFSNMVSLEFMVYGRKVFRC